MVLTDRYDIAYAALVPDQVVHVVMGSGIVFGAYWRPDLAFQHARCITGTTVAIVDLDTVPPSLQAIVKAAILDELPPEIVDDLQTEWEHDDVDEITPVMEIPLDEIDESVI